MSVRSYGLYDRNYIEYDIKRKHDMPRQRIRGEWYSFEYMNKYCPTNSSININFKKFDIWMYGNNKKFRKNGDIIWIDNYSSSSDEEN